MQYGSVGLQACIQPVAASTQCWLQGWPHARLISPAEALVVPFRVDRDLMHSSQSAVMSTAIFKSYQYRKS